MTSEKRLAGERPGQAVVEFALVSLMLLALCFGTLDLGRAVFARALLTNAVREAARAGSVAPGNLDAMRAAAAQRSPGLGLTGDSAVIVADCYRWNGAAWAALSGGCAAATSGDRLVVRASYPFALAAPRLIGFAAITMNERAQVGVQ